jgi:hypothetical protein
MLPPLARRETGTISIVDKQGSKFQIGVTEVDLLSA